MNSNQENTLRLIWLVVSTLFNVMNPPSKVTVKRKLPDYHPDTNNCTGVTSQVESNKPKKSRGHEGDMKRGRTWKHNLYKRKKNSKQ